MSVTESIPIDSSPTMNQMWGEQGTIAASENSERVALFRDGNYGMFIHWGLYSHLGGRWKGQTFYGIGEWIMDQMHISADEYQAIASEFNPVAFDAETIVGLAKSAGMKWIIITAKHHEGFAMFKSAHPFNIVDASPFARDPMHELAAVCRREGLGFGFYYSHNQDWTAPGGTGGPAVHPDGTSANFVEYFRAKCYPQVRELCTRYGTLDFVWFDTPGDMPKSCVLELAELVKATQPNALLCSRIGYGLGDYATLGDMEVPAMNAAGLWETCDTTNDSWSYAWYDQNWKDSREILHRLVSTIGRGGSYLLNIGPDGSGAAPAAAVKYLRGVGEWIGRYPEVIYGASSSPWGHELPWGDVTVKSDGTINLVVFDWPPDGRLLLPGVTNPVKCARLLQADGQHLLAISHHGGWLQIQLPTTAPERLASVIELELEGEHNIAQTLAVFPNATTNLLVDFATVAGASKNRLQWMEKFGEWKFAVQVDGWQDNGRATWDIEVAEAGDYKLSLTYRGEGRIAWAIETGEGFRLQNEQNSSDLYATYTMGILTFSKSGRHTIEVSPIAGYLSNASLKEFRLEPLQY